MVRLYTHTDGSQEWLEESRILDISRADTIDAVDKYDKSEAVNSFSYKGISTWMDRELRMAVNNGVEKMMALGEETYPLWLNNTLIELPCDVLLGMLVQLEVYAVKCYNVTARHKAEVSQLTTIEEIENYDIKEGYPARLVF